MSNVLGSANTGLQPDTWYSIQSYATDYYIGVGNSSSISQVSSGTDDTSLWQFLSGSTSASYAIRSKSSEGLYCLYPGPTLQECSSTSAQYRVFAAASDEGANIFVPSTESDDAGLYVSSDSSQGDAVETAELDPLNVDEVELLFAISSVSAVDTSAYPTALPSPSSTSTSSSGSNATTRTSSTSQSSRSVTPTPSSSSSSSSTSEDTSSTSAPTSDAPAAPSTASSTITITQDAPVTDAAVPTTSTVLVDPSDTLATTAPSAEPSGVELSTGAGNVFGVSGLLVGMVAAVVGLWVI